MYCQFEEAILIMLKVTTMELQAAILHVRKTGPLGEKISQSGHQFD